MDTVPHIPHRPTIPADTGPPRDWKAEAARGASELGQRAFDHSERPRSHRERRPRASALAWVALSVALLTAFSEIGFVAWHQSESGRYEGNQRTRHKALMDELGRQRTALYGLTDVVAGHHPEAGKVSRDLARSPPPGAAP